MSISYLSAPGFRVYKGSIGFPMGGGAASTKGGGDGAARDTQT